MKEIGLSSRNRIFQNKQQEADGTDHEALNTEKDRAQSIALGYFLLMG